MYVGKPLLDIIRRGRPNASKAIEKQTKALGLDKYQYNAFTLDLVENTSKPISEQLVQKTLLRQQEADAARKDRSAFAKVAVVEPIITKKDAHEIHMEETSQSDAEAEPVRKVLHSSRLAVDDDDEEQPTEPAPSPDEPSPSSAAATPKKRKRDTSKSKRTNNNNNKVDTSLVHRQPPNAVTPTIVGTLLDLPGSSNNNESTSKSNKKRKRQSLEEMDPFVVAGMSQLPKPKRRATKPADGTERPKTPMSDENKANVHRARNNHRLKYNFHRMQHRHRLAKKAWLITQNQPPFDWTICASEMPTTAAAWLRAVHMSLDSLMKDVTGAIAQFNLLLTQGNNTQQYIPNDSL